MAGSVALRREAKIASILDAAWELAREVGMRQPSLYEYFASKHALYDAMFAAGNRQLLERLDATTFPHDRRAALKKGLGVFVDFALEDRARNELLFQRHIPGFSPT